MGRMTTGVNKAQARVAKGYQNQVIEDDFNLSRTKIDITGLINANKLQQETNLYSRQSKKGGFLDKHRPNDRSSKASSPEAARQLHYSQMILASSDHETTEEDDEPGYFVTNPNHQKPEKALVPKKSE